MRFAFIVFVSSLLVSYAAMASESGTYRPGQSYHSVTAGSPMDCAAQCKGDAQCKGWNFIRPRQTMRTGVCEFNALAVSPVPSPLSVSGESATVRSSKNIVPAGTNTVRVGSGTAGPSAQPSAQTRSTMSQPSRHQPIVYGEAAANMPGVSRLQAMVRPSSLPQPQSALQPGRMSLPQMAPGYAHAPQPGMMPDYRAMPQQSMPRMMPQIMPQSAGQPSKPYAIRTARQMQQAVGYPPRRASLDARYGSGPMMPQQMQGPRRMAHNLDGHLLAMPHMTDLRSQEQLASRVQPRMMQAPQAYPPVPAMPPYPGTPPNLATPKPSAPQYPVSTPYQSANNEGQMTPPRLPQQLYMPPSSNLASPAADNSAFQPRIYSGTAPRGTQSAASQMQRQPTNQQPSYQYSAPAIPQAPFTAQPTFSPQAPRSYQAPYAQPAMSPQGMPTAPQPPMPAPAMMPQTFGHQYAQAPQAMPQPPMTSYQAQQSLFGSLHDDVNVPRTLEPQNIPTDPNMPIPTVSSVPTQTIVTHSMPGMMAGGPR